jgi:hypothetical protein
LLCYLTLTVITCHHYPLSSFLTHSCQPPHPLPYSTKLFYGYTNQLVTAIPNHHHNVGCHHKLIQIELRIFFFFLFFIQPQIQLRVSRMTATKRCSGSNSNNDNSTAADMGKTLQRQGTAM